MITRAFAIVRRWRWPKHVLNKLEVIEARIGDDGGPKRPRRIAQQVCERKNGCGSGPVTGVLLLASNRHPGWDPVGRSLIHCLVRG